MTATKIQPGNDTHLTLLMAPHSLNFVTGADRTALLAYGRDVFAAGREAKCLAQIQEPAQPVCWIRFCSDGSTEGPIMHSQICEARKTSGAWTPLYAGAAPAAVAGPAWSKTRDSLAMLLLGLASNPNLSLDVACIALDAATESGMPLAYLRGAPAAPALEAPAAPVIPASVREALEFYARGTEQWITFDPNHRDADLAAARTSSDWREAEAALNELDEWLAAAPKAPAAPWKDHQTARLVNDLRDCAKTYHAAGQIRDRIAFIVAPLCDQLKAAQAAPAAPAVGALPTVEAFGRAVRMALRERLERKPPRYLSSQQAEALMGAHAVKLQDCYAAAQAAANGERGRG